LRPAVTLLERSVDDSAQIFFATPSPRSSRAKILVCDQSLCSRADGVGNNPDAVAFVGGTQVAGANAMPFRVIADLGQVSEYVAQPSIKQRCHVLQDREARSYHANGSNEAPVQSRSQPGSSGAFAPDGVGERGVLTGEATTDDINGSSICVKRGDVVVAGDAGPMLGEDALAERVELAEVDGSEPGALEAETDAADPGEQVEDIDGSLTHVP
jgi:hypothetical protein